MRRPETARIAALSASALCLVLIYFAGCSEDTVEPELPLDTGPQETSTWEVIQNRILNEACVGCHISGSSFARQSDLVLTSDVAYSQLIERVPNNQAARGDGMLLVGTGGLASLAKSFLWEKINAPNQEHFFADHPQYGGMMPLGLPSLTNGELAYLKQWIIAGAPADNHVVDRELLKDTSRYEPPEFLPMDPPESGYQLSVGPFTVAPNYERELFYYVPLGNTEDVFVQRTEIRMRSGSHHFILYRFGDDTPLDMIPDPNVIRDIRDPSGEYIVDNLLATQYHRFLLGTQWPLVNYTFPTGVAMRLPADSGLDLNSHFVNRSNTPFDGEVVVNLHTVPLEQVQRVAEPLFLNHNTFELPPKQVTTES
ncbi:MAG: hypothetical protein O7D32_09640, partial [bacterium]|nr:hypothetical protein [bacterium]